MSLQDTLDSTGFPEVIELPEALTPFGSIGLDFDEQLGEFLIVFDSSASLAPFASGALSIKTYPEDFDSDLAKVSSILEVLDSDTDPTSYQNRVITALKSRLNVVRIDDWIVVEG